MCTMLPAPPPISPNRLPTPVAVIQRTNTSSVAPTRKPLSMALPGVSTPAVLPATQPPNMNEINALTAAQIATAVPIVLALLPGPNTENPIAAPSMESTDIVVSAVTSPPKIDCQRMRSRNSGVTAGGTGATIGRGPV
jgi:hypothetical protein